MKDILNRALNVAMEKYGAEYAEARAERLLETILTLKEGTVEAAKQGMENGVALRVLVKGTWGFATLGSLRSEMIIQAISDACCMAKTASERVKKPIKLAQAKPIEDKVKFNPKRDPSAISIEEKLDDLTSLSKSILDFDRRVKSCTIDYLDTIGTASFANSEGSYIEQPRLHVWSRMSVTASEANILTSSREELGSTAGYVIFDKDSPEKTGEKVSKRAVDQLEAKPAKGGSYPVILGPSMVGVLAHEAFGHLAEADLALSGSILASKYNKKIASDLVTMYDDGTIEGAFGSFKYDDEGITSQKTLLMKEGVTTGFMHNRETAFIFKAEPTGNARAEDFRVDPLIRMRNTYIKPKDHSFQELIEELKFGYYLKSFMGGQANLDGTFQVGVQEGCEIVKGELGGPIRNASISGNTLETLLRIDAIGKDFELSPGRCGKGQEAFVCDGGPHIRVKEVLIGGSA